MPIEIRELVIKAVVQDNCATTPSSTSAHPGGDTDAIIAQCVEQVMNILKEKQER